jgi:hypothetical protein
MSVKSFEQLAFEVQRRHNVWFYKRFNHVESIMVSPEPMSRASASVSLAIRFGPLESLRPGGGND